MSLTRTLALLLILAATDGLGPVDTTQTNRCRCINKEKNPIGRYIRTVVVSPANSHCSEVEIIATLKKDGQKVCLDPEAWWVKKVLLILLQRNQPKRINVQTNHTRLSTV